jgi:hypothetical protein
MSRRTIPVLAFAAAALAACGSDRGRWETFEHPPLDGGVRQTPPAYDRRAETPTGPTHVRAAEPGLEPTTK